MNLIIWIVAIHLTGVFWTYRHYNWKYQAKVRYLAGIDDFYEIPKSVKAEFFTKEEFVLRVLKALFWELLFIFGVVVLVLSFVACAKYANQIHGCSIFEPCNGQLKITDDGLAIHCDSCNSVNTRSNSKDCIIETLPKMVAYGHVRPRKEWLEFEKSFWYKLYQLQLNETDGFAIDYLSDRLILAYRQRFKIKS